MTQDALKVEWTRDNMYIVLGEAEIELSRAEAESLFVTLGHGLQDMDLMEAPDDVTENT